MDFVKGIAQAIAQAAELEVSDIETAAEIPADGPSIPGGSDPSPRDFLPRIPCPSPYSADPAQTKN